MSLLERVVIGLGAATIAPAAIPWLTSRTLPRAVLAAAIALWTIVPPAHLPLAARLLAIVPVGVQFVRLGGFPLRRWLAVIACTVAVGLTAALVIDSHRTGHGFGYLLHSDRPLIVLAGWILVTFGLGKAIGGLTRPLAQKVASTVPEVEYTGLSGAGRYIGWLERTLLYGALLFGRVEAIALVVTIKSIARFPSLRQEVFADYFLIGTLLSLVGAIAGSVLARLALGLGAL